MQSWLGRLAWWGRALLLLVLVLAARRLLLTSGSSLTAGDRQLEARLKEALDHHDVFKGKLREILGATNTRKEEPEEGEAVLRDLQEKVRRVEDLLEDHYDDQHTDHVADAPSPEYEMSRRRLSRGWRELRNYLSAELRRPQGGSADHAQQVADMAAEHLRSLQSDLEELTAADGHEAWRRHEAAQLSDLVQRRLRFLQNPPDCASARKLVFRQYKPCGFGCQLHYLVFALLVAYGTQRTMVLDWTGWPYPNVTWEDVFQPFSDSCHDAGGSPRAKWPGSSLDPVVELRSDYSLKPRPQYLPPAVPRDLAPRLARLYDDPAAWWVGQFLQYLLRPRNGTARVMQEAAQRIGFVKPIVGIHVRRTDKLEKEAKFHPLEEYMRYVEEYFLQREVSERRPVVRRVFIATDDPDVITDARNRYPQYEVLGDLATSMAAGLSTRYANSSLYDILSDLHLLSRCDYLVCTFTSNVCRAAYEIMQTLHLDATDRVMSLDKMYYFHGQKQQTQVAVLPHRPRPGARGELELRPGDLVAVTSNRWDGWSEGRLVSKGRKGRYPSF